MAHFQLWFMHIQLFFFLFSGDLRIERIDEALLDAAEDPLLEVDEYAHLVRFADQLLGR